MKAEAPARGAEATATGPEDTPPHRHESAYERVVANLERHGSRRRGRDWQCPGHQDRWPSLTVTPTEGAVLINCHAGCPTQDVVRALGLRMADLYDERPTKPTVELKDLTVRQRGRYTQVRLETALALPEGALRVWVVGAALGKMMRQDGSFRALRTQGEAVAIEVRRIHRDRALGLLGMSDRVWRRAIRAIEAAALAHRCEGLPRGTVRLFYRPEATCPLCEAKLSPTRPLYLPMYQPPEEEHLPTSRSEKADIVPDTTVRSSGHHSPEERTPESGSSDGKITLDQAEARIRRVFGAENVEVA